MVDEYTLEDIRIDGWCLICPSCGQANLHQGAVRLYDRGEDAMITAVTTVHQGRVSAATMPSDKTRNPSDRRHGLAIAFSCEQCDAELELTIAQHKGATLIVWRMREVAKDAKRWPGGEPRDPVELINERWWCPALAPETE